MAELGDELPEAIAEATVQGGKAAGKAVTRTADELAENEELQKALVTSLGAGGASLMAGLTAAYGPAVAATIGERIMTTGAGHKTVDKMRETALAPETWETLRKALDALSAAVPGTPPPKATNDHASLTFITSNYKTLINALRNRESD